MNDMLIKTMDVITQDGCIHFSTHPDLPPFTQPFSLFSKFSKFFKKLTVLDLIQVNTNFLRRKTKCKP